MVTPEPTTLTDVGFPEPDGDDDTPVGRLMEAESSATASATVVAAVMRVPPARLARRVDGCISGIGWPLALH